MYHTILNKIINKIFHRIHFHKGHGYGNVLEFLDCRSCNILHKAMRCLQYASTKR